MTNQIQASDIKETALSLGFDLASVASIEIPSEDQAFLMRWCAEGNAGGMNWLARDPGRRADLRRAYPGALSLIALGVSYFQGPMPPKPSFPVGRVARYAWGEDYHEVIGRRLEAFLGELKKILGPEIPMWTGLDAQPILERAFARRAGLGFAGKNTNLIAKQWGSWIFLAEIVVGAAQPPEGGPAPQGCGGCTSCQTACPTGALERDFRMDARLCVSYHTIENRGGIPVELRPKLKDWLFGCDDCQSVCPFNARAAETRWPEFAASRGAGAWVALEEVLELKSDEAFRRRFRGTPLLRAKRAGLVRNACIIAANTGARELVRPLRDCMADPEAIVREHACWALERLSAL